MPSYRLGAALAAAGAGWLRDLQGGYDVAFYFAAGLCGIAALLRGAIRRPAARGCPTIPDDPSVAESHAE